MINLLCITLLVINHLKLLQNFAEHVTFYSEEVFLKSPVRVFLFKSAIVINMV